ncbi:MAG: hypothetical protein KC464_16570, partial [Myxococcales bacterium]|nr:hypothetical protein [Myxococcales bacterium]
AAAGCKRSASQAPPPADAAVVSDRRGDDGGLRIEGDDKERDERATVGQGCERLPFAADLPLAEASGAAVMTVDGRAVVLVVGDSGTAGAYVLADATTGEVVERGQLPLGTGAGDDVEGISTDGDAIWGVTSAGWMRRWRRDGHGFALVDGPYPVAPVDDTIPLTPRFGGIGATPTDSLACRGNGVNCGKNYEGLCVAPGEPPGGCAGYLAAKADGRLWCLVRAGARLVADPTRSIDAGPADVLAGCDVSADGASLWLGANGFGGRTLWRVTGWREPATAQVAPLQALGDGFPEAIALGPDDVVYRFSDTGGAPSLAGRWRCPPPR